MRPDTRKTPDTGRLLEQSSGWEAVRPHGPEVSYQGVVTHLELSEAWGYVSYALTNSCSDAWLKRPHTGGGTGGGCRGVACVQQQEQRLRNAPAGLVLHGCPSTSVCMVQSSTAGVSARDLHLLTQLHILSHQFEAS